MEETVQQKVTIELTWAGDNIRFHMDHTPINDNKGGVLMCLARGMVDYAAEYTQRLITLGEVAFEKDMEQKEAAGKVN